MNPALLAQLSNIGLILFAFLYFYASTRYDGGSKLYPHKKSWDWIHNYWCDLIWPKTILEEPNRASKLGIAANFILCLSCILFFNALALVYAPGGYWPYIISISGTIAMLCAMIIFSELHDRIIGVIILTVIPAIAGVIYGLLYFDQQVALYWGLGALLLIIVNIYIFYTNHGELFLPFIQKIAFVVVLSWIFFINTTIN